jgi:hypothetical protein
MAIALKLPIKSPTKKGRTGRRRPKQALSTATTRQRIKRACLFMDLELNLVIATAQCADKEWVHQFWGLVMGAVPEAFDFV